MAASSLAVKDGNGSSQTIGTFTDAAGAQRSSVTLDSAAITYRAAKTALTPVATPTVVFQIAGSATKTVRVKKISVVGAATAYGTMPCTLYRSSDAGTLGSAVLTAITAGEMDSAGAAATAVVATVGTANYTTVPAAAGIIGAARVDFAPLTTAATSSSNARTQWVFDRALVLRGVAEVLAINFNSTAVVSGGVLDFEVEWEEDAS
jgi:hypothetical protein